MNPVHVVGMGLSPDDLTQAHLRIIGEADVLVGGKRHLALFPDSPAEKKAITGSISSLADYIRKKAGDCKVVALASGDPLLYGIGATLIRLLGPENVVVHPNISSVAAAFARLKLPWHNARIVSMHGRDNQAALRQALGGDDLICVLTSPENHPGRIAEFAAQSTASWDMWVLEQMGSNGERISSVDPRSFHALMIFQEPNLVVLQRKEEPIQTLLRLGTPDGAFVHEKGLITKAPVRAVTLSMLELETHHTLWDLGAGSGSVGLEASLFVKAGRIWAVEKNPERVEQIGANRERFAVHNLEVVHGSAPECLAALPAPDRVFAGGGGRSLEAILRAVAGFLKPGGLVVANTVLLESISRTSSVLESLGMKTRVVQVQVSESVPMPWGQRMEAHNPVWIITGRKEGAS